MDAPVQQVDFYEVIIAVFSWQSHQYIPVLFPVIHFHMFTQFLWLSFCILQIISWYYVTALKISAAAQLWHQGVSLRWFLLHDGELVLTGFVAE